MDKKAPVLRLGLFESGRRNRIQTNDNVVTSEDLITNLESIT